MDAPPLSENPPAPPAMPLASRLANVFVAPAEVFDDVKRGPAQPASWIVPTILAILTAVVSIYIIFSQPAVIQQLKNTEDAQETRLRQQVAAGKSTQAQVDQQIRVLQMLMTPSVMKVAQTIGAFIGVVAYLFLAALALWLIAKFSFRSNVAYGSMLEVVGLSFMITALGTVVALLLAVIYGVPGMTLGPAMFVSHLNAQNPLHQLLAAVNVMALWFLWVLSVGLSRVSGATVVKSGAWIFGIWAVVRTVTYALVWLQVHAAAAA